MTHLPASRPALARAFIVFAFALTGCGDNTVSPPGR
jgi:predicted small secreted protein